jgi:putative DNA primase/helicase
MDAIAAFVEECCVVDVTIKVRLKDLYGGYQVWCRENGFHQLSSRMLKQKLKERGYDSRNSTGNQVFVYGLGMRG